MLFLYIVLFFIILIYFYTKTRKSLQMLQQNFYNENNRYLRWLGKNLKVGFVYFDLIGPLLVIALLFFKDIVLINIWLIMTIAFYMLCEYLLVIQSKSDQNKKPLVTTSRVKRMWITLLIIYFIPFVIGCVVPENLAISAIILTVFVVSSYLLTWVIIILNYPIEKLVSYYYVTKARKKLDNMNNLKVIGITGSYGKTSSKNILNDILGVKYITKPTPLNFNTYYGLMITVNQHLDKFDDVFIAEMGAYAKGDIKQLCDLVKPKYGILTTIGTAHLESFGTCENIVNTKFELIESLPVYGLAVLNADDDKQISYNIKNKVRQVWIGIHNEEKADILAKNIICTSKGTSFDIYLRSENKSYKFETKLLGYHSVYNILSSVALGIEFGISMSDLQSSVRKVKAVEHRLELKKLGAMYQIDDAYNSNPIGASMALEVLNMMPGTKVVVTPGMTDLGSEEDKSNFVFGTQIASVADYVLLVGKKKTKPIYEGLLSMGYPEDKICIMNDVRDTYPVILGLKEENTDIYALFENDLPDSLITNEE